MTGAGGILEVFITYGHKRDACARVGLDKMKITKTSGILDIPELYKYLPYDDGEDESETVAIPKLIFDKTVTIKPGKVVVIN